MYYFPKAVVCLTIHSSFFTLYLNFNKLTKINFDFVLDLAQVTMKENDADDALGALESRLLEIISQTTKEEHELQAQQKIYASVSLKSNALKSSFLAYQFFLINSFSWWGEPSAGPAWVDWSWKKGVFNEYVSHRNKRIARSYLISL